MAKFLYAYNYCGYLKWLEASLYVDNVDTQFWMAVFVVDPVSGNKNYNLGGIKLNPNGEIQFNLLDPSSI